MNSHQTAKAEIWYKCEFCTRKFTANKKRRSPLLCRNCIEIRRLIRTWVRDGVWVAESQESKEEK